jgi:hypothetical protein
VLAPIVYPAFMHSPHYVHAISTHHRGDLWYNISQRERMIG